MVGKPGWTGAADSYCALEVATAHRLATTVHTQWIGVVRRGTLLGFVSVVINNSNPDSKMAMRSGAKGRFGP